MKGKISEAAMFQKEENDFFIKQTKQLEQLDKLKQLEEENNCIKMARIINELKELSPITTITPLLEDPTSLIPLRTVLQYILSNYIWNLIDNNIYFFGVYVSTCIVPKENYQKIQHPTKPHISVRGYTLDEIKIIHQWLSLEDNIDVLITYL